MAQNHPLPKPAKPAHRVQPKKPHENPANNATHPSKPWPFFTPAMTQSCEKGAGTGNSSQNRSFLIFSELLNSGYLRGLVKERYQTRLYSSGGVGPERSCGTRVSSNVGEQDRGTRVSTRNELRKFVAPSSHRRFGAAPGGRVRPQSQRKRGGQSGHLKRTRLLILTEACDLVMHHRPAVCTACGFPVQR